MIKYVCQELTCLYYRLVLPVMLVLAQDDYQLLWQEIAKEGELPVSVPLPVTAAPPAAPRRRCYRPHVGRRRDVMGR